jgi:acyl-CoA reductase-like NAD-dependent aldehyde dehydrogenase
LKAEVVEKLAALITAAFGLIAALAWNDTIKAIFEAVFGTAGTIRAMLVYAVVVTIIAVFAAIQIGKVAEKAKK